MKKFWVGAGAEGVGVGWVSFYRPEDVRALLHLLLSVVPVAWLCVGYPDERPTRPGLEAAGWERRRAVEGFVFSERWGEPARDGLEGEQTVAAQSSDPGQLPVWGSTYA